MSLNFSVSEGSSYEHNELPLDPPLYNYIVTIAIQNSDRI